MTEILPENQEPSLVDSTDRLDVKQAVALQATALYHELQMLANQERSDAIMGIRRGPAALSPADDRKRVADAYSLASSRLDRLRELIENLPSNRENTHCE